MSTIYTPEQTARILDVINGILLSNNGYSRFDADDAVVGGVMTAGFVVFRSTDLHGNPCYCGSTTGAQFALRSESFSVSTYKAPQFRQDEPDYEGAILARQERMGFYD